MKKDAGFAEFNAVLILFFVAAAVTGVVIYASSSFNYSKADDNDFRKKARADVLLDEIMEKMQALVSRPFDDRESDVIASICGEYGGYGLKITDVSSGFNLNFMSDADIADASVAGLLFADNSGSAFLARRNLRGLAVDKEEWRGLIKEEAWEHVVCYGWLNKNDTDSFAFRNISGSFGTKDTEKLFPVVNNFPRMNVNMVNPEILRPLVKRSAFKIERPDERADALIKKLNEGPLTHAQIASIMGITVNHPLAAYLGTKTAFWKLNFEMPDGLKTEAIAAAVPLKDGKVQEIEKYRLTERRFSR